MKADLIKRFIYIPEVACSMAADRKDIIARLHPLERRLLPHLMGSMLLSEAETDLSEVEAIRAVQWLENKGIVRSEKRTDTIVSLGKNGERYRKDRLPEIRLLEAFRGKPEQTLTFAQIKQRAGLADQEWNILIGLGRRMGILTLGKGEATVHTGRLPALEKDSPQPLLEKLAKPMPLASLSEEEQAKVRELQGRKDIIVLTEKKDLLVALTDLGKEVVKDRKALGQEYLEALTPQMLRTGSWKGKTFRPYDVAINVPAIHGGKRHPANQAIEYIRKIWIELGFEEMRGTLAQTALWDLDALFVPQDHPARTMQDTFYIRKPGRGDLSTLAPAIKAMHEHGADTESLGWQYDWSEDEAEKLLLRTHTTVLSAQTLANAKDLKIPGKYFAVGKVFRNETLDWKHLFEFDQVEGIVVGEDVNLAELKGYLRDFYRKMGYQDIRMRPAHFPYTEPSMEIEALHPRGKWIELGGAGIFRPEITQMLLGREVPVLAWGLGMARIIAQYFAINDIRDLYRNDVAWLRDTKIWSK